jgi:hypothetical protein
MTVSGPFSKGKAAGTSLTTDLHQVPVLMLEFRLFHVMFCLFTYKEISGLKQKFGTLMSAYIFREKEVPTANAWYYRVIIFLFTTMCTIPNHI